MDSRVQAVWTTYEFDDVVVEPLSHRLLKAGREIALEPKVFATLLEFLRRPGQTITHDELLDAVWQHHHVTPAALARVVSILRRQLEDPPDAPRYIRTVHRLGYRFVAAVKESHSFEVTQPCAVQPSASPQAGSDPAPTESDAAVCEATTHSVRPGRPFRASRLAWAALAAAAVAALGTWTWHARSALHVLPATSIAVLPLSTPSGEAELSAAAAEFSGSLIDALARMPGVRTGGSASARAVGAAGAGDLAGTAHTLGVDNVVFGQIQARGSELGVRLELWRRGSAAPQLLLDQNVPRTQLFRALTQAVDSVQATLPRGVAPASDDSPQLSAQELYLLGRSQWQDQTQSSLQRALEFFQRAIDVDPNYALAWCGLADTYLRLQPGALSEQQLFEKARAALAQAKLLAPEAADTFVSEGMLYEHQSGHRADALVAFKRALDKQPWHPLALLRYGNDLRYSGRVRDAIKWHGRASDLDPLNVRLHNELAVDYVVSGDDALAGQQIARVLALDPDNADVLGPVGYLHERKGELAEAARAFAEKIGREATPYVWQYYDVARVYLRAGAADLAEQALSLSSETDSVDYYYQLAGVRMAQGRYAEALEFFAAKCPPPTVVEDCTSQQARLLALLDRGDEARALYTALFAEALRNGAQPVAFWPDEFYWHHFAAWLALLPPGSIERDRGMALWASEIQRMEENGVKCASVNYQRASQAALSGDEADARRQLEAAIAAGWLDAAALDRDLEWRPYARTDWLVATRKRIATLAAVERAKLPAPMQRLSAR